MPHWGAITQLEKADLQLGRLGSTESRRMSIDRRGFLNLSAAGAAVAGEPFAVERAIAGPRSSLSIDAMHLGVRPGSPDDQSRALQDAIDQAAGARVPLALGPGVYRAGNLRLPSGTHIIGVRGATRIVLTHGPSLISANHTDDIALTGLTLDGAGLPLPEQRGLVQFVDGRSVWIIDCDILASSRHGVVLEGIEGEVTGSTIVGADDAAIFSLDARGLRLAGNTIRASGNNGILVWRSAPGDDGTLILDNRIEDIAARAGGSGQNGNAINVFRAGNVMVRGNRINRVAFSAIRGNAATNLQMLGNTCTGLGEAALYAEYSFEGAMITNNIVDGAELGVAVTNFREGGRLAVVQGNVIRNLAARRPASADPHDSAGVGISVEADTSVTGNVIENAPSVGIQVGWGEYLRDVTVSGNVVRDTDIGIAVSVVPGTESAVIADNLISGTRRGAILGMDRRIAVTGELANGGGHFAQLAISGNQVR
jgi:uncharacterized secreted repeat protein (TIGR03808 family)